MKTICPTPVMPLLALLIAACAPVGEPQSAAQNPSPPSSEPPAAAQSQAKGAVLLQPFKEQLQGALKAGLQQGPAEAVDACRVQAPAIAAALAADGVRMGRASHRLRNPANTAPAWAEPLLESYLADPADRRPRTVAIADDAEGYVEPIVLQPMCTTCHGSVLAPDLDARISALYPDDQAVGFEPGELRGIFWVEYPLVAGQ